MNESLGRVASQHIPCIVPFDVMFGGILQPYRVFCFPSLPMHLLLL